MKFVEGLFEALKVTVMNHNANKNNLPLLPSIGKDNSQKVEKDKKYELLSIEPKGFVNFNEKLLREYIGDDSLIQTKECMDFIRKLVNSRSAVVRPEEDTPELKKLLDKLESLDVCNELPSNEVRVWGNRKFVLCSGTVSCLILDKKLEMAYKEVNAPSEKLFDETVIESVLKGTYGVSKIPVFYNELAKNPDYAYHMEGSPSREMKRHIAQAQSFGLINVYGNNNHIILNKEKFVNVWLNSPSAQNYENIKESIIKIQSRVKKVNEDKLKDKTLSSNQRREAYLDLTRAKRERFVMK